MDVLTKEDFAALLQMRGVCISIYLSTHPRGPETLQDSIRLKNLLESASRQVLANGLSGAQVTHALAPVRQFARKFPSLRFQDEGLAIFACGDFFRYFRLPVRFREVAVVGKRFHLKPLLPLLSGDGQFYLLAISDNQVRLFQGARHNMVELHEKNLPGSLREALETTNFERQRQLHTAGSSGRIAIHHGHVAAIEDKKQTRLQYFRQIDTGLRSLLHQSRAPLLLAGVEELFPIYREANTYPLLLDNGVTGNPDRLSAEDLHRAAWKIAQPYFAQERTKALAEYRELSSTPRASNELRSILPAIYEGRAGHLFIKTDVELWGTYDQEGREVILHREPEAGDEDLLDLAAVEGTVHGGTVYALPSEEMPDGADIAALFGIEHYSPGYQLKTGQMDSRITA